MVYEQEWHSTVNSRYFLLFQIQATPDSIQISILFQSTLLTTLHYCLVYCHLVQSNQIDLSLVKSILFYLAYQLIAKDLDLTLICIL